jgi:quercetin 2,3-dioxygenase
MVLQSKGKIFLSAERGLVQSETRRCYSCFNSADYQQAHKEPFGDLYVLNDITLAGGESFHLQMEEDSLVLMLPVVGAIAYRDAWGDEMLVNAGQIQTLNLPKGMQIELTNPYKDELINFLQIAIRKPVQSGRALSEITDFDMEGGDKILKEIVSRDAVSVLLGKFDGRQEAIHHVNDHKRGLFAFVIEGAFEIQGRLLEAKDGLALWNDHDIEMEALSNGAIILLIEPHV